MRAVVLALPLLLLGSTFAGTTFTGSSFGPPVVATTVTASLVASRVSGPAPLGVHFDATATTDSDGATTDPFRQLGYAFDAGDGNTATYSLTGQLKRRHRGGPLFAYVYETPGTYTAMVRAQNASGDYDDAEVSITVTDPDVVYATTDTICVSPTSAFGDCPGGATTTTTLPARTAYTDKRVLLHRGESFGSVNVQHDEVDFQIGAYGTGAKPIVTGLAISDENWDGTIGQHNERFAVYDIDRGTGGITFPTAGEHMTYLRVEAGNLASGPIGWYLDNLPSGWAQSDFYMPRYMFFVDGDVQGGSSGSGFHLIQSGFMGNVIHADGGVWHAMRTWVLGRTYIADSIIGRTSSGGQHSLKTHAGGITLCDWSARVVGAVTQECASRKMVIARNQIGDATSTSDWIVGLQPQNSLDFADEGVEDAIMEDTVYVRGTQVQLDLRFVGRRLTSRGESVSGGGTVQAAAGACGPYQAATPPLPAEWCGPTYIDDGAPPQPAYPQ